MPCRLHKCNKILGDERGCVMKISGTIQMLKLLCELYGDVKLVELAERIKGGKRVGNHRQNQSA